MGTSGTSPEKLYTLADFYKALVQLSQAADQLKLPEAAHLIDRARAIVLAAHPTLLTLESRNATGRRDQPE
jgi:hypothetical protein